MRAKEASQILDRLLTDLASEIGFVRTGNLEYSRRTGAAMGLLSFPSRVDPRGFAAFTCFVAMRFNALGVWLGDDSADGRATFGTPIHLLREGGKYMEWKFACAADLKPLRGQILGTLDELAIPFIERYSKLADVRKAVESPDPKDWIGLGMNPQRRVCVLAAIQWVEGDRMGAMKTVDDALAERQTQRPKYRYEIEDLRKRFVVADSETGSPKIDDGRT